MGHFSYNHVTLAQADEASFALRTVFPSQKAYETSDARVPVETDNVIVKTQALSQPLNGLP